ncbi:MAG: hypothetical protein GWP06_06290 [Actinobacteria bacterium]|nr:hypothetical protein [Actinomycetota bacterium]
MPSPCASRVATITNDSFACSTGLLSRIPPRFVFHSSAPIREIPYRFSSSEVQTVISFLFGQMSIAGVATHAVVTPGAELENGPNTSQEVTAPSLPGVH